ncbi:MAG: type II toxin-antitoxin system VapC family toxin [Luteolibacter sp.]
MILDTNVLIKLERELKKGEEGPATRFLKKLPQGRICITPTVAGEFRSGNSMANKKLWNEALAPYEMLKITPETSWIYGEIYRNLAARGSLIGANDMWIAATALTYFLPVATGNTQEFQRVENLTVLPI